MFRRVFGDDREATLSDNFRLTQPLNDRKLFRVKSVLPANFGGGGSIPEARMSKMMTANFTMAEKMANTVQTGPGKAKDKRQENH